MSKYERKLDQNDIIRGKIDKNDIIRGEIVKNDVTGGKYWQKWHNEMKNWLKWQYVVRHLCGLLCNGWHARSFLGREPGPRPAEGRPGSKKTSQTSASHWVTCHFMPKIGWLKSVRTKSTWLLFFVFFLGSPCGNPRKKTKKSSSISENIDVENMTIPLVGRPYMLGKKTTCTELLWAAFLRHTARPHTAIARGLAHGNRSLAGGCWLPRNVRLKHL